jgi:hypothetical protein
MEAVHDHMIFGERRNGRGQLGVGLFEQRPGLRVPPVCDDDFARIDMHRAQSAMLEKISDDQAGQAFPETRDCIDGARRQLAQYCQALHQLRDLLEMLVHRALHAGLAQMIIAERDQFAQSLIPFTRDREVSHLQQPVGGLAHRRDHHHWLAIESGPDDSYDAFDSFGGFDRGPAEFHDDHVAHTLLRAAFTLM